MVAELITEIGLHLVSISEKKLNNQVWIKTLNLNDYKYVLIQKLTSSKVKSRNSSRIPSQDETYQFSQRNKFRQCRRSRNPANLCISASTSLLALSLFSISSSLFSWNECVDSASLKAWIILNSSSSFLKASEVKLECFVQFD